MNSNPVAPTTLLLKKTRPENGAPVVSPVVSGNAVALMAQGLAEAAQALLKTANALLGGESAQITFQNLPGIPPVASLPHLERGTVREVINEFLISKARAARSDRYLRQLRVSLSSFAQGRGNSPLCDVTPQEVEKWLHGLKGGQARPKTQRNYLGDVATLFNFARRRNYVATNPAQGVDLPADDARHVAPGIHTPDQVRAVLEFARARNLDACRLLAVRYFAGVRSAEGHRLREENILADRGLIEIPALKAKTKSRRLVKIQPCLAAWLALGGELRPMGETTLRELCQASGVPWPHNVTRHSFVSYHVARFQNAGKTALEAGHSESMLFKNYRALVTPQAAREFFSILPKT